MHAAGAIDLAFRTEGPAVLATLVRQVRDFDLAEEALQDAVEAAVASWERDGVPASPGAWITTVARRRAIDRLRMSQRHAERAEMLAREWRDGDLTADGITDNVLTDDRLRLLFTCCHPALSLEARVALTLRCVGGLSTPEVARAMLVTPTTMAQRITRAKRKITAANIPYRVPDAEDLPARVSGVLAVVYLVFNEGYSPSAGPRAIREDICAEGIRLGRLLVQLLPGDAEAEGLLALMLLLDARRPARLDQPGRYIPLDEQDRTLWIGGQTAEGVALVERALARRQPGPYQLQAAITALHNGVDDPAKTDWPQIAALYGELARRAPSPVVEINRAVAVSSAGGDGLALLHPLLDDERVRRYAPLHAAHAELLRRDGDTEGARAAYGRAIAVTENTLHRAELARRRDALAVR